ncbi:MAG: glucose-6-phosphate isomerase [Leptospiraceae bacterium]|nr:MAG: glucose-6-phosphate isomerase [Leptospiraceae bacterium]
MVLNTYFLEDKNINLGTFEHFYGSKLTNDLYKKSLEAIKQLENKSCKGSDFLGWLDLPQKELNQLQKYEELKQFFKEYDTIISIGIGGSYLGIRAIIEALKIPFQKQSKEIIFAGHHLSSRYLKNLLNYLDNKNFALIVISKSGTTAEPAIAFRFLYKKLIEKFGEKEISKRIIVITDKEKGTLRKLANQFQLKSDIVPDDVGGRYSVLSPVGLIPLSIMNIDIKSLLEGALSIQKIIRNQSEIEINPALQYALYRNLNYALKKQIEILSTYRPELFYILEWWKQLYGESEGKNYKGIYPASSIFTTDLHSLGQWIQEGERNLFETLIDIQEDDDLVLFSQQDDSDGLNYLSGKSLNYINRTALQATRKAHISGGVPNFTFEIKELNEFYLGILIYLFEYACAISALTLEINPFDQPGVEAYKTNMFKMLGKPGY